MIQQQDNVVLKFDDTWTVSIINNIPIHKKYINIIELAGSICPAPLIKRIVYDGKELSLDIAQTDMNSGETTLFLCTMFDFALKSKINSNSPMSLSGHFWLTYIQTIFKLFLNSCLVSGNNVRADLSQTKSILEKGSTLGSIIAYVGTKYDVEPPLLRNDLFRANLIGMAISQAEATGAHWVRQEKNMIEQEHICLFNQDVLLSPYFIRSYFKWATGNINSHNWPEYVPSFNCSYEEIEKVNKDNMSLQLSIEKNRQERKKFDEDMDLLDRFGY